MNKFIALLLFVTSSSATAANVLVTGSITSSASGGSIFHGGAGTQVSILNSQSLVLPVGSQIRLGFFQGYSAALDATLRAGILSPLFAGVNRFIPFGESTSPAGYGNNTEETNDIKLVGASLRANVTFSGVNYFGAENDLTAANTLTSGGVARGTKVFMFIYNSQSIDTSASDFQYGLYSASNWFIPATGTADASIQLQHVDTAAEVYWGTLGSLKTASPVPEPSMMCFGLGVLGFISARRRR